MKIYKFLITTTDNQYKAIVVSNSETKAKAKLVEFLGWDYVVDVETLDEEDLFSDLDYTTVVDYNLTTH